ncbi:hypothetical protein QEG73_23040 [Chitinophagaceae bacterium 26-R-25]|nr:hypothetical protein [Chitinophagaceae bacterium 26-R-25]
MNTNFKAKSLLTRSFLYKLLLLIVPLTIIVAIFIQEGAFTSLLSLDLADIYALVFIRLFLFCYIAGMLVNGFCLFRKGKSPREGGVLIVFASLLLIMTLVWVFDIATD